MRMADRSFGVLHHCPFTHTQTLDPKPAPHLAQDSRILGSGGPERPLRRTPCNNPILSSNTCRIIMLCLERITKKHTTYLCQPMVGCDAREFERCGSYNQDTALVRRAACPMTVQYKTGIGKEQTLFERCSSKHVNLPFTLYRLILCRGSIRQGVEAQGEPVYFRLFQERGELRLPADLRICGSARHENSIYPKPRWSPLSPIRIGIPQRESLHISQNLADHPSPACGKTCG